jgi:hypothetical protein
VIQAPAYLERLNGEFFADPTESEQVLVREMANEPILSSAANRWLSKADRGTEDADPFLIARVRASIVAATVVTEESQEQSNGASVYAVCGYFDKRCINLQQMMTQLGWRF